MAKVFPYPEENDRLTRYRHNAMLLDGEHYDVLVPGDLKKDPKARLRYVMVNFNALVANVIADMLFGEEVQLKADKNQQFIENLYHNNQLKVQFFESAVSNAALGDALFKVRVEENEIVIEDTNPSIYFPRLDAMNARQRPKVEELAWTECHEDGGTVAHYLVKEIQEAGAIRTEIYELTGDSKSNQFQIGAQIGVDVYNAQYGKTYVENLPTGIKRNLLVHVPNYRSRGNARYFGQSDFVNLESLQRALNKRMTSVGGILDKHSDPILAVPEGVLDEEGNVRKEALGMIEVNADGSGKPEYIVWNANLEAAFMEIDKIVEFLFLISETNGDVFGMGKTGQAETGRALKMRLLRTIAKRNRKRLYYDQSIKEVLEIAQLLSVANGYTAGGIKCDIVEPVQTVWADGIVDDAVEHVDMVTKQVETGIKSKKRAIEELNGITEKQAEEELEAINKDGATFSGMFPVPPLGQ
jgi:hypothetical protein